MLYFERWKMVLIALVCAAGLAYSLPNFFPKSSLENVPDWLPNKQVNLGLDLRGGVRAGGEQPDLDAQIGEILLHLVDARLHRRLHARGALLVDGPEPDHVGRKADADAHHQGRAQKHERQLLGDLQLEDGRHAGGSGFFPGGGPAALRLVSCPSPDAAMTMRCEL